MTTLNSQTNILKEVYEKRKKMDRTTNEAARKPGQIPAFMKNRGGTTPGPGNEDPRKAKSEAARRRLAMMRKPKGK